MSDDSAIDLMARTGGSFVRSLANCYLRADATNRRKLREAFAEYFDGYERKFNEQRAVEVAAKVAA